ncbi:hypothetical protein COLO4_26367 [Corchorus olitorius]|uniref:Uncharacterized protein n=1 Tax=Corchorus olitorius TaxID=93759 RepID=A0A1R3HXD5_9ROSI|nr:hypothetical protein COLO4_26367 [Corchorus olitorius]
MMHQQNRNQDPPEWWKAPIKLKAWKRPISFASILLAVILYILKGYELHFEEAGKEDIVIILKSYSTLISGFMISFSTTKIYAHPWRYLGESKVGEKPTGPTNFASSGRFSQSRRSVSLEATVKGSFLVGAQPVIFLP